MTDAKRHFTPGLWGRCGRAIPDPQAAQMEDDTSYHAETLNQGRDATNPVPKCSMYAGKPVEAEGDEVRAVFWQTYAAIVALTVVCVVILANWPV